MKKFTVLALAALLVVAFTVPASALENIFGGYWHTRFATQKNFDGDNTGALDIRQIDTRTRLFYTAKLNDKLKLVNKFEMDTQWGNANTAAYANNIAGTGTGGTPAPAVGAGYTSANWGDLGADGVAIEIKNSYADFNVGPVNFLVGIQNFTLARSFLSNDDAAGMKAIWKVNDGLYLPFVYQKLKEGGAGRDANEYDIEAYVFAPVIMLSKDIKISPYYALYHAEDAQLFMYPGTTATGAGATYNTQAWQAANGYFDNMNGQVIGLDFDAKMGAASIWFTGVYQFGNATVAPGGVAIFNAAPAAVDKKGTLVAGDTIDLAGYLLAAGGKFDFGKGDIHAQGFYATGEDLSGLTDKEWNAFFVTTASQYGWAEIMGQGAFDNMSGGFSDKSTNAPGIMISNIMALNLGVTVKPMDKLSITADLWYAKLAEEKKFVAAASNGNRASKQDELGLEADLKITYQLVEGLSLDLIGAYLFAGDATSADGKNDKDPYEFGTRLTLSF